MLTTTLLALSTLLSCWAHIPLPELVQQRPLIVSATVDYVATAPASDDPHSYRHDIAFLNVTAVHKTDDEAIQPGRSLPLIMPATANGLQVSTDIRYPAGTTGVWLLSRSPTGAWTAAYPGDLQTSDRLDEIVALIANPPAAEPAAD